jgi:hypothetical protein
MPFSNMYATAIIITSISVLPFGQTPRRDFKVADFRQLRWIEGKWQGEANGEPFYERYHFTNDSTLEQESYRDASFRIVTDRATFALRNGRIIDESAKSRYEAVRFNGGIAQFIPVKGASNSFQFTRLSKDRWTATIIPNGGRKKTVYEMRRIP